MSRIRKVNEGAVYRTIEFLVDLQLNAQPRNRLLEYTISDLYKMHRVSKSIGSICKKLKWLEQTDKYLWWWKGPEVIERKHALIIMDVLLKQSSKRTDMPLSGDFITAIERLTDSMNILSTHNEKSLKSPLLSRALQQSEMNNNHLFSVVDNKDAKLFELVKHIAGNCIDRNVLGSYSEDDESMLCDAIIRISKMLISKL